MAENNKKEYKNDNEFCMFANTYATPANKQPDYRGFITLGDSIQLEISGWNGANQKTSWIRGGVKIRKGVEISNEEKAIYDSLCAIMPEAYSKR